MPGAAIGILHRGMITTAYYGVTDATTGERITPETLFGIGSITKPMVATMIVRLEQAGRLSLDDPVADHVPELRGSGWAQGASLSDLLANRSGLPLRAGLEFGFASRRDEDDLALSRFAADVPADVPAANFWSYTNVGWSLLGRVIETATDSSWEDAMRRQSAAAGMPDTTFALDDGTSTRVSGHEVTDGRPLQVEPLRSRAYGPAGANTASTVDDLLRFAALHLADSSLAAMRAVQAKVPIYGWLDSWCLGWGWFDWAGGAAWGWDGVVSGQRSMLRILPDHQAAVVLLTNADTGRAMHRSLCADLIEPLFGIRVPPLNLDAPPGPGSDLSRYAGTYAWPDRRVQVTAAAGGLLIDRGVTQTPAYPLDEKTFLIDADDPDNPTVTFDVFDADGRPHVLYLMLWGLPRLDD